MPGLPQPLTRHGRDVVAVFDLLGDSENDLTSAFGFVLARSRVLRRLITARLASAEAGDPTVALEVRGADGRTDLEIQFAEFLVIIEAKRGWLLPEPAQLEQYATRIVHAGAGLLLTLSDCSERWASEHLPPTSRGVPVRHLPWTVVLDDVRTAIAATRSAERTWLTELDTYLRGAVRMGRPPSDAWVFTVALSRDRLGGPAAPSFKDYVVSDRIYFHPFGKRWPKEPPIFLGFRWGAQLRQVNRIESSEVVATLPERFPEIPAIDNTMRPHVVHQLSPPLSLPALPNGPIGRNDRHVWVLLDQLLAQPTLVDAERESKRLTT